VRTWLGSCGRIEQLCGFVSAALTCETYGSIVLEARLYSHGFCFSTYLDHINLYGAMFCSTYSVVPTFCNLHFDPIIVIVLALAMTLTFQIIFSLHLSHCFGKEMVAYIVSLLGHCYKCGICVPFIFICRKYIQSNFLEIQSLEKGSLKTRTML
jgi:hypothetical protein